MTAGALPEAYYLPDGPQLVATQLSRGPWSAAHQHGGPPAALLVRAVERALGDDSPMAAVRVTVDFLRPVPIGRVEVDEPVLVRPGRGAQLWTATLRVGSEPVCRAAVQCIRRVPVALPERTDPPPLRAPEQCAPFSFDFFGDIVAYHRGVELRLAAGAFGQGDMAVWFRLVRPLVAGEEPSPMQRVVLVADAGNGVGVALPVDRYSFPNADLTVALRRPAAGAWVGLHTRTTFDEHGTGLADSTIHDEHGYLGRGLQCLVVSGRGQPAGSSAR